MHGLGDIPGRTLNVSPYPVAWRLEIAEDEGYHGLEYVR